MRSTSHGRPNSSRSGAGRGSVGGSIALLALFAAVLVVASYPWMSLALAAGAVGGDLARRVIRAFRRRRRGGFRTPETAAASDALTPPAPE